MDKNSPARAGVTLSTWQGVHLLRKSAQGDEAAFEAFYHATSDRLYGMAWHLLKDEGFARDALQETYLRIWKKASNYDPARSNPLTWATLILRGVCFDQLRKKVRRIPEMAGTDLVSETTERDGITDIHLHELVTRMRSAMAELSAEEQTTLQAALFDPASNRQLAERWRIPPGTVKTRIHRALQKLKQRLLQ